ncbi:hypothetical protein PYW07_000089 [Mythimna separata]|uniref:Retrovirus-related Pol polyprotein from transposon TNT 1-94 n=1 Tax=Mythimna separata TaxID=271217 RepID=A0AAD7Z102_MYTSE|nr:hypothetical protein PYW07_000089 [Mythimna separata]
MAEELSKLGKDSNYNIWKNNTDIENYDTFLTTCYNCGRKGHIAKFCREDKGFKSMRNNSQITSHYRCYKCLKSGHKNTDCKEKFNCVFCKSNTHYSKFCLEKQQFSVSHFTQLDSDEAETIEFILDSGASSHIINSEVYLHLKEKCNYKITTADGNTHIIDTVGKVLCKSNTSMHNITFNDVLLVPKLKKNLLSISKIADNNYKIVFFRKECKVYERDGSCLLTGELRSDGLYYAELSATRSSTKSVNFITSNKNNNFWHRALAHTSISKTQKIVNGINTKHSDNNDDTCEVCARAKLCRKPFNTERYRASRPLEIVHSDICGPIGTDTYDGYKYFITFLDDYTHFAKIYLIRTKSEAFSKIINFINLSENHFNLKIKTFRCDNGGEYTSNQFKKYCLNKGIAIDYTIPYTPQHNGKAERLNRTIMERTRALLFDMNLPKELWGEAVLTATYITNRCSNTINEITPAEMWFNRIPNLKHLNIFGSLAYYKINTKLNKLDSRCNKGLLVGFAKNGYKIWDPMRLKVFYSRDVIFNNNAKDVFEFLKQCNKNEKVTDLYKLFKEEEEELEEQNKKRNIITADNSCQIERGRFYGESRKKKTGVEATAVEEFSILEEEPNDFIEKVLEERNDVIENEEVDVYEDSITEELLLDNNRREVNLEDSNQEVDNGNEIEDNSRLTVDRNELFVDAEDSIEEISSKRILPKRDRRLPIRLKDYDLETSFLTYSEVLKSDERSLWEKAIKEEKDSLEKNKTWEVVDKTEAGNRRLITSKWIFTVKPEGRYKARLVARGFLQKYNIDYKETYSPVVNTTSVRLLLSIAAQKGLQLKQFDVKTAFLYGELNEDIFMEVPLGYDYGENKICKLKKSLYGLKQAPLMWNKRLTDYLKKLGFQQLKSDPCLFLCKEKEIYLAIYVDDGILIGNCENELNNILKGLQKEFEIKIFDKVERFIGLDIDVGENYLKIYQESYIKQMLNKFGYSDLKEIIFPNILVDTHQEGKVNSSDVHRYRQLIGSLLYLVNKTRPDVSFHVGYCSRHQESPNLNDFANIKNLFRYLKSSISSGIQYLRGNSLVLTAYCDADFAGDPDTRKSTTGFVVLYSGGPIHWCSRKQSVTALSSTEAEYISAAECIKDLLYVQSLIKEITGHLPKTQLFVDNQSAIVLIKNGILNRRSKHIDVKYHFIKEKIDQNLIEIFYCPTNSNIADILTKGLDKTKFLRLRKHIVSDH